MILTKKICARLAERIKAKDTTSYKIAKALGISASTIGNYINGNVSRPDRAKLIAVCDYLEIDIHWLETEEVLVNESENRDTPQKTIDENTAYQIKQIFLKLQARDDQYMNLHQDLGYIRRYMESLHREVCTLRKEVNAMEMEKRSKK
ncbi:MAG: helix-turn-helix transcriptional regulator [Odoribacter sp.]